MDSQVYKKNISHHLLKALSAGMASPWEIRYEKDFCLEPKGKHSQLLVDTWFEINMEKRHNEKASLLILIVLYLQKHSLLEVPLVGKRHIKSSPTQNKTAYCWCSATCAFPVFPHPLFFITLRCLRGSKLPKGAMFLAFHGRLPLN